VTCWRIDSSPSISTPRSRTTVTGWMTLWPTLITLFSGDSLRRFVSKPNHRISVLVAFSCSRFTADHELTSETQSSTPVTMTEISDGSPLRKPSMSSANKWWRILCLTNRSSTSSVYSMNRSGPRTDPCGTPKCNGRLSDSLSPTRTIWLSSRLN